MATENFKQTTQELFTNYVELHKKIEESGYKINLSFREYLDFYIKYGQYELELLDNEDYDDEEESSEEDEE